MTTATIRKKLLSYIEHADSKKVKGMYLLVEDEIDRSNYALTDEQISIVEEERMHHINGKIESFSWKEAKAMIRRKKTL